MFLKGARSLTYIKTGHFLPKITCITAYYWSSRVGLKYQIIKTQKIPNIHDKRTIYKRLTYHSTKTFKDMMALIEAERFKKGINDENVLKETFLIFFNRDHSG